MIMVFQIYIDLLLSEGKFEADLNWMYSLQSIMVGNHGYDDDEYINSISIDLTDNVYESDSHTYIGY